VKRLLAAIQAAIIKGEAPVGAVNAEHWTRRP